MNTSHYPSLELCKKLTESGFPDTEYNYIQDINGDTIVITHPEYDTENFISICPSVMELLGEMPRRIIEGGMFEFLLTLSPQISPDFVEGNFTVQYLSSVIPLCDINISGTLPNTLAEMWLWLVENGYINKAK